MQAGCGKKAGNHADDRGRGPDGDADHREAEAYGQGVDAGRHRQHDHGQSPGGVLDLGLFAVVFKARAEHALGHEEQQAEGDPVVEAGDQTAHGQACAPADHRHQGLEKAEVPGQPEILAKADLSQRDAGGDGHGKGVHGQGHCNGDDVEQAHAR